jgi:predicted RNA-binding Zn ribbon-like protein
MRTWSLRSAADPTPPVLGGRLSLAFVNSVLWRRSAEPDDLIPDYPALVAYLSRVGVVDQPERDALTAAAKAHPGTARRVHGEAIALREALFRALSAAAAGTRPAASDLRRLTATLRAGLANLRFAVADDGRLTGSWPRASADLDWPLWEIAGSAAALLSEEPLWLKQCPGDRCGWLFVDRSRSHSRRWCSSAMCGNRDRARRHYERSRGQR